MLHSQSLQQDRMQVFPKASISWQQEQGITQIEIPSTQCYSWILNIFWKLICWKISPRLPLLKHVGSVGMQGLWKMLKPLGHVLEGYRHSLATSSLHPGVRVVVLVPLHRHEPTRPVSQSPSPCERSLPFLSVSWLSQIVCYSDGKLNSAPTKWLNIQQYSLH